MKLQAEIGDDKYELEIKHEGDRINAVIDGEPLNAQVSQPEPNVFLFKHEGQVIEAFVVPSARSDAANSVWIKGREYRVKVFDPKRLRGAGSNTDVTQGLAEVRAAMPGKVVRVLHEAGAAIEKGDGLIIVEAMKMQNELKSPKTGIVKTVNVSAGDTVSAGDVLAAVD